MKNKQLIKQIIRDFHIEFSIDVKKRDLQIPINSNKIITLIGVRRSGKTSILYDTINKLSKNIGIEKIIFFNFEDERIDFSVDELNLIIEAYRELYPKNDLKKCYFFFDEIQNINGWEKFIRRVYDSISKNIFITGSNSKLLSSEIATSLRGRTISFEVYPLSFKEYLNFKDIKIDFYSSKSLAFIKNALDEYLQNGGFVELLFVDKKFHSKILQEYFNTMIYKDLIERYEIKNIVALKFFLKRVLSSNTKQISINKIYNELKSNNIKIGKNTLYEFLEYAQNIFLIQTIKKFDNKLVSRELGEKKVFSIDIGLSNAIDYNFSNDLGKALENIVFLELKRDYDEIYFYNDSKSECDFIAIKKNETKAIQVSYDISENETKKREIKGLINACKKLKLNKGLIITYDIFDEIEIDGIKIDILPFYRFVFNQI